MASLEYVVRPWQARNPQGAIIIPSTPVGTHERATITWGGSGTIPAVQVAPGSSFSCCNEAQNETGRKTETIQVLDSSNPENWVMVNRTIQLSLDKSSHSSCASDWDQFSGIGMEITDALAEFSADFFSGPLLGEQPDTGCKAVINLNNNTIAS